MDTPDDLTPLAAGHTIGPYELVRCLGEGTYGQVWLVRHVVLGERRAMKIPTHADYVRQLRSEATYQYRVDHPNVVQTIDIDPMHDPPYFVMEYVEGENLRARLDALGKLPLGEALDLVRQVLEALRAAHAQRILHRDLKPENVLLAPDGTAKVTDFGLGHAQADLRETLRHSLLSSQGESVAGTVAYMSPEQQAGREPTPSDDLYAVGILACELLTGKRPAGAGVGPTMRRAGIPEAVAAVVGKACDERDYRYATAAKMLADLAPLAEEHRTEHLITNAIGMKLVLIRPGSFLMGSERGFERERPVHRVTVTQPFYLGVCPVTQGQFQEVMGVNPSRFGGADRPVERVSWTQAAEFCRRLADREGRPCRLPTEGEWEYACRAGSADDAELSDQAWHRANSGGETHPVGLKAPNAWGLHDMHGSVLEWCADRLAPYPSEAQTDPGGPTNGTHRVLRGGCWYFRPFFCRAAARFADTPDATYFNIGFRVATPAE